MQKPLERILSDYLLIDMLGEYSGSMLDLARRHALDSMGHTRDRPVQARLKALERLERKGKLDVGQDYIRTPRG
jgi:hypothetical protein